jgi:GntR family transcriptional repressor for pyruvate dehydrogenase complex
LQLHRVIARASKNANYITFFNFLSELYRRNLEVSRTRSAKTSGRGRHAQDEHLAVYEAIKNGDPEAARRAARTHVENTGLRLKVAGNQEQ